MIRRNIIYRKIDDFILDWLVSMKGTLQVLQVITDEKLDQSIVEGHKIKLHSKE